MSRCHDLDFINFALFVISQNREILVSDREILCVQDFRDISIFDIFWVHFLCVIFLLFFVVLFCETDIRCLREKPHMTFRNRGMFFCDAVFFGVGV